MCAVRPSIYTRRKRRRRLRWRYDAANVRARNPFIRFLRRECSTLTAKALKSYRHVVVKVRGTKFCASGRGETLKRYDDGDTEKKREKEGKRASSRVHGYRLCEVCQSRRHAEATTMTTTTTVTGTRAYITGERDSEIKRTRGSIMRERNAYSRGRRSEEEDGGKRAL